MDNPRTDPLLARITRDPLVMGGKACIRGIRVTVGTVLSLMAAGHSHEEILGYYPYLEKEDVAAAIEYAAKRTLEAKSPLSPA